ncbi:hypothetical protein MA16_Dca013566 [Dendrobium catenatum]|uniref:Uncharacterized protein n=1 Tax=Dendrobium catenatum TaxID=906689 RepID=A0A2I0VPT3_9ASPA|nr:hypothetical protein MA16_Dca013566 [Dendrobium catenatum]
MAGGDRRSPPRYSSRSDGVREIGGSKGSDSSASRRDGGKVIEGSLGGGTGSGSSGSSSKERRLSVVGPYGTGDGEAERKQLVYTYSPAKSGGGKPEGSVNSALVSG